MFGGFRVEMQLEHIINLLNKAKIVRPHSRRRYPRQELSWIIVGIFRFDELVARPPRGAFGLAQLGACSPPFRESTDMVELEVGQREH